MEDERLKLLDSVALTIPKGRFEYCANAIMDWFGMLEREEEEPTDRERGYFMRKTTLLFKGKGKNPYFDKDKVYEGRILEGQGSCVLETVEPRRTVCYPSREMFDEEWEILEDLSIDRRLRDCVLDILIDGEVLKFSVTEDDAVAFSEALKNWPHEPTFHCLETENGQALINLRKVDCAKWTTATEGWC